LLCDRCGRDGIDHTGFLLLAYVSSPLPKIRGK
jgi:hypothetical protein